MLILMRLKTELSPFDRLRLHKSALMLNIFGKRNCFDIEDPRLAYFDEIDALSIEIKNLQSQYDADTKQTLEHMLKTVDSCIKESYRRSIPYLLQSATFVNSIFDNKSLIIASAIVGILSICNYSAIKDIEYIIREVGYPQDFFSNKDILTTTINLEKTGVLSKTDVGYCLSGSLNNVSEYQMLI
ncbi:MAG: hypothetical protein J6T98_07385 [Salinivirgaceae bacterium]|nr:hypothetical protein [Salinivirgaceae bacterium]